MGYRFRGCWIFLLALALGSCKEADDFEFVSKKFTVRIENVSTANLVNTPRADGTVPLSPGVYAVYDHYNPMFRVGMAADEGISRIAEDGFPEQEIMELQSMSKVLSGTFMSPGGPDNGPAIFAGEVATFTFRASPGDRLQIATMFVQSNDWFYAFGDKGLDLFDGLHAVEGDVTSHLVLYDAGTEEDTAPGTGPFQKPVQDPLATNIGPDDAVNQIQKAATRHPDFTIPSTAAVIKVTITHQ
ncbi:spondin domain-containing protein [Pontibacter sp. E15-1]|uniref:spondin domain-containing protein n=1 Tax=Pontibacter sp. E15-1 TaxID=2919918 RepID=UPI001F4F46F1|nr:spondin domain-containing protein [Pontibacter sp. E15-1]MCJ8165207.1 spondin domain-containing protein [Pontibacter sp. E15-1]